MRPTLALTPFVPWLLLLASCSSPPKPPNVDESQKRPMNSQMAVELQVCKNDLQNTRLLATESGRLAETTLYKNFFRLGAVSILLIVGSFFTRTAAVIIPAIAVGVIWMIAVSCWSSAMTAVFQLALYRYATQAPLPSEFAAVNMADAFGHKKGATSRFGLGGN